MLSDWKKADPRGSQWASGGHWVLDVKLTCGADRSRDRSAKGQSEVHAKAAKKKQWSKTGVWPWWIHSGASELTHWKACLECRLNQDGLIWMLQREAWLRGGTLEEREMSLDDRQQALETWERAWNELYGLNSRDELREEFLLTCEASLRTDAHVRSC